MFLFFLFFPLVLFLFSHSFPIIFFPFQFRKYDHSSEDSWQGAVKCNS